MSESGGVRKSANKSLGSLNGAEFSSDRMYRYALWRTWSPPSRPRLVIIGLNPSTADEQQDDPTIRRCLGFARRLNVGGLVMLNLFALRSTDPKALYAHDEPSGDPMNSRWLAVHGRNGNGNIVVAAWGVHGAYLGKGAQVAEMLPHLQCFGVTRDGHPRHPLYLRTDTPLQRLSEAK